MPIKALGKHNCTITEQIFKIKFKIEYILKVNKLVLCKKIIKEYRFHPYTC